MKGGGDQTGVSPPWENWWFEGNSTLYALGAAFLASPVVSGAWLCPPQLRQLSVVVGEGIEFLSHWDGGFDTESLLSGSSPNDGSPDRHLSLVSAPAAWPAIRSGG